MRNLVFAAIAVTLAVAACTPNPPPPAPSPLAMPPMVFTVPADQPVAAPPCPWVLVPVDGSVYLTPPLGSSIGVSVAVDPVASGASYAAKMLAAYVIDNLIRDNLQAGYYDAISHCVNAIQDSWHQFAQSESSTSAILDSALQTVRECRDLQEKLVADPNEEQHVLAAGAAVSESDVAKVVEATGEAGWKDEITTMLRNPVVDDILEDAH